jgi:hypothetical protein
MENNNNNQATIQDVLVAISDFSYRVDKRFEIIEEDVHGLKTKFKT